ncbi:MAG: endolytic transglycosylase MltG [Prevotellaceae bacterium]|jgi:UPF0755 protein|nr:endolytic transglycosylase MltG [Prevotellaceae bacterium]
MTFRKCNTFVTIVVVAFIYMLFVGLVTIYKYFISVNVVKTAYVFIHTGSSFEDVVRILRDEKVLKDEQLFITGAKHADYTTIRSGKYRLVKGMRNRELIRVLASGQQVPVNLTIAGNIRSVEKLASIISRQIEADSAVLSSAFNGRRTIEKLGFTADNVLSLFIPNTYEVYWNISADGVMKRMKREYDRFWNEKRMGKLKDTGLSREEVIVMASIVNEETSKTDEMPKIAGVYMNRVNKKMKLDADPTLKFAMGDFTLKRILDIHKEINSPYNTYKNTDLPPGPICVPSIAAIDAVLGYEKHDYYYFCAKADFSGYHAFSKTLAQHNQYANDYHNALNKLKIYR